jgi:hypothetical protein
MLKQPLGLGFLPPTHPPTHPLLASCGQPAALHPPRVALNIDVCHLRRREQHCVQRDQHGQRGQATPLQPRREPRRGKCLRVEVVRRTGGGRREPRKPAADLGPCPPQQRVDRRHRGRQRRCVLHAGRGAHEEGARRLPPRACADVCDERSAVPGEVES